MCAGRKSGREGAHTGDKEAAAREVGHKWSTERDIKGGEKKMIHVKYSRAVKLKKISSVLKIKEIIESSGKNRFIGNRKRNPGDVIGNYHKERRVGFLLQSPSSHVQQFFYPMMYN